MNLNDLKIGYVPYLPDLSQPGDRRRFPLFAKRNGFDFEVANENREYDIVLLTAPGNLSKWLGYKKDHPKTVFLFEMVDSLILDSDLFNTLFKGIGRLILKKEDSLYINYKKLLVKWLRIADVVICSNDKLREAIEKHNKNVFVSLDYMRNEVKVKKSEFKIGKKLQLVWEGQGNVIVHFQAFKKVLSALNEFCELHIITDQTFSTDGEVTRKDTRKFISGLPIQTYFHKWEMSNKYDTLVKFDCGFIPINPKNKFGWYKPANKLLSFWFAGLPTFTSATPAYRKIMDEAGLKYYCENDEEWVGELKSFFQMTQEERRAISDKFYNFAVQNYSSEYCDSKWKEIFNSAVKKFSR